MNDESLGIIRRGWQQASVTLAPHVSGLTELLQRRLDELADTGDINEPHLMGIVDEALQLAVDSGSAEVTHTLGMRLRRTVYEYLLSLDAIAEPGHAHEPPAAIPQSGDLIGAEEIAAMQPAPTAEVAPEPAAPAAARPEPRQFSVFSPADEAPGSEVAPHSATNGSGGEPAAAQPDGGAKNVAEPTPAGQDVTSVHVAPRDGFHIGDPSDFLAQAPESGAAGAGDAEPQRTAFSDPSTWPTAMRRSARAGGEAAEGAEAAHASALTVEPPSAEIAAESPGPPGPPSPTEPAAIPVDDPATVTEAAPVMVDASPPPVAPPSAPASSPEPVTSIEPGVFPTEPRVAERPGRWSARWPGTGSGTAEEPAIPRRGWATRERPAPETDVVERYESAPTTVDVPIRSAVAEVPLAAVGSAVEPTAAAPEVDTSVLDGADETPEADLAEVRARLEEKLRKKKCDDAAAMMQSLAQETGGRQVAELALDAGDRCRGLGKANAALNCYLAASRADPVYEAPLARLADICIDDQDIDLAVSYLERIARLMRLRGDAKGALRIYRKIATVAPYRDDVLELLMRAQSTGKLDV